MGRKRLDHAWCRWELEVWAGQRDPLACISEGRVRALADDALWCRNAQYWQVYAHLKTIIAHGCSTERGGGGGDRWLGGAGLGVELQFPGRGGRSRRRYVKLLGAAERAC